MNIAVSFSLCFVKTCLICHKEVFKTLCPLFTELSHITSFFKHFSAYQRRVYINQNMFNLSSPQDQVSNFIVIMPILINLKLTFKRLKPHCYGNKIKYKFYNTFT